MNKDWRDNRFFKIIEEFIISPLGYFSNEYGKIALTVSTICICLFITRPMADRIELPAAVQDTVGDIPIIEHWDDGEVEIMPTHTHTQSNSYNTGWTYPMGMVTASTISYGTADVIWGY